MAYTYETSKEEKAKDIQKAYSEVLRIVWNVKRWECKHCLKIYRIFLKRIWIYQINCNAFPTEV